MAAFVTFWTSGVAVVLAVIAAILVHGGWEAAAAAVAIAAGTFCLTSLIVLWVESEHLS
jgi:hypothetical protein